MKKEPQKIKLTDSPSTKEVKKIPLPPIDHYKYDKDSVTNENNSKNNS